MSKDGANSALIETLSGNKFFAGMMQDYLTFMAGASQRKRFKAGEVLRV